MNKEMSNILRSTLRKYDTTCMDTGYGIVSDQYYYQYDDFNTTSILHTITRDPDTEHSLENLQAIVGGNIEIVPTKYGDLVINEMGKLNGLGANFFSTWIWFQTYGETDYISGNTALMPIDGFRVDDVLTDMLARDWHHYYRVSAAEDRQSWAYNARDIQAY
mgnify:FL=1